MSERARGAEEVVKVCIRGAMRVREGTGWGRWVGVEMCRCRYKLDFGLRCREMGRPGGRETNIVVLGVVLYGRGSGGLGGILEDVTGPRN